MKYFQGVLFLHMYQPLSCNSRLTFRKPLMILRKFVTITHFSLSYILSFNWKLRLTYFISIVCCLCFQVSCFVCVYEFVRICVCVYMYVCMCICVSVCACIYIYMYMRICVCVCVYVHMYICMHIYICVCMCVCIYSIYMYLYVYIYVYVYNICI